MAARQEGRQAWPLSCDRASAAATSASGFDGDGHRNIQHTVRYTELSPGRFKDFWR
jgi:hypothetical protein